MRRLEQLEPRLTPASISFEGGSVAIVGTESADTVNVWEFGGNVTFTVSGGGEFHRLVLPRSAVFAVTADLLGGDDLYSGRSGLSERVFGGAGNDTLYAGFGNAFLDGGAGDDTLHGGFGFGATNVLVGGAGRDTVRCGFGNDVVVGHNPGEDTLLSFGAFGDDVLV